MEANLLSVTLHAQLQQARGKAVEDGAGEEISDLPLTVTEEEVVDPRDLATGLPSATFHPRDLAMDLPLAQGRALRISRGWRSGATDLAQCRGPNRASIRVSKEDLAQGQGLRA
jgi:hypothetical protein